MQQRMGFHEVWQSAGRQVAHKKAAQQIKRSGKWRTGIDAYVDYLHDKGLVEQFVYEGTKPTTLSMDDYLDGLISRKSAKWISDYSREEPFFLWVNFSGPQVLYVLDAFHEPDGMEGQARPISRGSSAAGRRSASEKPAKTGVSGPQKISPIISQ